MTSTEIAIIAVLGVVFVISSFLWFRSEKKPEPGNEEPGRRKQKFWEILTFGSGIALAAYLWLWID